MRTIATVLLAAGCSLAATGAVRADSGEPNDTTSQAVPLVSGEALASHIATANDVDYYVFVVASTQHVRLDLTVPVGRVYTLTLLGAGFGTPQPMAYGDTGGDGAPQRIDWTVSAGTYWVRVQAGCCSVPSYDPINAYILRLTAPQPGDTFEPNETVSTATGLPPGQTVTSYVATGNDVDFYTFVVQTTQHIRIDLTIPAQRTYGLTLLSAGASVPVPIAYGQEGGAGVPQRIDWTVVPGTYWIRVQYICCAAPKYDAANAYTLRLTAPQPGDTFEPNETFASAAPLVPGRLHTSFVATSNDVDFYAFALTSTRQVRLDLTVPALRSYALTLYGGGAGTPQPVAYGQGGGDGVPQVIERSLAPGTYYVRVAYGCCSTIKYDPERPYTLLLTDPPSGAGAQTLTLAASPTSRLVGGAIVLTARMTDGTGKPIAGEVVQFLTSDRGVIGASLTDAAGVVSLRHVRTVAVNVAITAKSGDTLSSAVSASWAEPAGTTPSQPDPLSPEKTFVGPARYILVFVHGLFADATTWQASIESLSRNMPPEIWPSVYAINFSDRQIRGGITQWGEELAAFLGDITLARRDGLKFVLVAHSAGGLAARQYLQSPTYRGDVAALITYGTPHAGTPLAYGLCGGSLRALLCGNGAADMDRHRGSSGSSTRRTRSLPVRSRPT